MDEAPSKGKRNGTGLYPGELVRGYMSSFSGFLPSIPSLQVLG